MKKPEENKNMQKELNKSVDIPKETNKTQLKSMNSSAIEIMSESNSSKEEGLTEIIKVIAYLGT